MVVRTRFAPSPTGFLHVGSVRTALFSYLFAKAHQGKFLLRIEDTDQERSTKEAVQVILEGMQWLGLDCDEGPFYQTQRYPRYRELAKQLLDQGQAYRCVCTKERLEALREQQLAAKIKPRYDGHCRDLNLPESVGAHVLRFKNPHRGTVAFRDEVYGDIEVDNAELDDLILIRSDGHPTYNFAVVVDDSDMQITHVIRGDDHINNTPRQINLFKALGLVPPVFAHLPMILGDDGKRLSKRHGAVSVLEFREQGFLPHALLNYLVRLGWSHGDQELFSMEEMVGHFDLGHVSRGVSSFNYDKLQWINQHYLRSDAPESLVPALQKHFEVRGIDITKGPALADLLLLQADRCKTLEELCAKSLYFYHDDIVHDEDAVKKHLRPVVLAPLSALYQSLKDLKDWTSETLQSTINHVCAEFNINMGKLGQPLRVAVTGCSMSPSMDMTLALLGKPRTLARLEWALKKVEERAAE